MIKLPQPIIDLMDQDDPDWRDYMKQAGGSLEKIPLRDRASGQTILYDGKLIVTYEGWDWTESLHICDTLNLKTVFETDLLNGPGVKFYEKQDTNKPGYVLLRSDVQYFYIEWT